MWRVRHSTCTHMDHLNQALSTWWDQRLWPSQGKFIVCGDSHTATHGHSAPLPLELGQQSEHVFATQTLWQVKPKKLSLLVRFTGRKWKGDILQGYVLALIAKYGVALGVGYVVSMWVRLLMLWPWKNGWRFVTCLSSSDPRWDYEDQSLLIIWQTRKNGLKTLGSGSWLENPGIWFRCSLW